MFRLSRLHKWSVAYKSAVQQHAAADAAGAARNLGATLTAFLCRRLSRFTKLPAAQLSVSVRRLPHTQWGGYGWRAPDRADARGVPAGMTARWGAARCGPLG